MPKIIDLIETSPGEWRFVKRLRLAWNKRFKQDAEARREQFFDSLAGEAIKPKPDRWWTGGVAVLFIVAAATVLFIAIGPWDAWFVPLFFGFLIYGIQFIAGLCCGMTWSEAFRSVFRP